MSATPTTDTSPQAFSIPTYTAEEVIEQFQAIFDTYDFNSCIDELELGFFQRNLRKKTLRELHAICVALWHVALQRSFPEDADHFFAVYCETSPVLHMKPSGGVSLLARIDVYLNILGDKGCTDFSPIARYLLEILNLPTTSPHHALRLSLLFRNLYTLIFNKLV